MARRIPIIQIDAFARRPFSGNPAAVVPLSGWPDDSLLQNIAMENHLSETAFFVSDSGDDADFELRWFSPTVEVELCGYATMATGHYILSRQPDRQEVRFRTRRAGVLTVARSGAGYAMTLPAWWGEHAAITDTVEALGLSPADVTATLRHSSGYALVVVENPAIVTALDPSFRALAATGEIITIVTAPGTETDIISRVFAVGAGITEDPVTGSAHSLLVTYWAKRLGRETLTAYQASKRGGFLGCRLDGGHVVLTGNCITVIEGALLLPD
ncbi:PhzF family phenazine biosynthesis protein [Stakelama sp. CBK3Z-3]|uniref:PhzF family phenazine biosynthesis protein n=1 Tax=Stakelama flava TaxID=2860338 RepID=A0ABS6XIP1_9SPHN|nr:PhzF family phenazine biosynthesis protein [Stakelama flava]MBW4330067.1 PhzF family phenazine biosynthesis protein [Stakelama flava]